MHAGEAAEADVATSAEQVAATSESASDVPAYMRTFLERVGDRDPGSSAKSALCISGGLLSADPAHVPVSADAALEQRQMYLDFLGRDALEKLVDELSLNIQCALGGTPLGRGCGRALSVSIDGGPWVQGVRAGAVLTVGRHPRCGLQIADAKASFVSRLQCIIVRGRGRLVVYDMCSLHGTEASASTGTAAGDGGAGSGVGGGSCCCSSSDSSTAHHAGGRMSSPRASRPDWRVLLVFPWAPGSELCIGVRCEGAAVRVRIREPPISHTPAPSSELGETREIAATDLQLVSTVPELDRTIRTAFSSAEPAAVPTAAEDELEAAEDLCMY